MARILYAVAGEGLGHCTRADLIGARLLNAGNDVLFVGFGKARSYLAGVFGPRVVQIEGLGFHYTDGRLDRWKTFHRNLRKFHRVALTNMRLLDEIMDGFRPELLICDFEPFSAYWAWRRKIPLISVDNEHLLTHCRLEGLPVGRLDRILAKSVTRCYAFRAHVYLVLSFFHAAARSDSVVLAPPVVRPLVAATRPSDGRYILVYLSTGQERDECIEILCQFPDVRFVVYGFDQDSTEGNCILKRRSVEGFVQDLAASSGVICSAGFSLISECIALGKPMLLLPVPRQYEQLVNAVYAERLGLGVWAQRLDGSGVARFLEYISGPRSVSPLAIRPDNERFFDLLADAGQAVGVSLGVSEV